jgi:hypothetical protein
MKPDPRLGMKYKVSKKGSKIRGETGTKNLIAWQKDNPRCGHFKHGVSPGGLPGTVKRYSDKRTREGKVLNSILNAIVQDLGGPESLNTGQQLILSGIQTKIIVILQVGKYTDSQKEIVNESGEILPVLESTYLKYQKALEQSLENLYRAIKPQVKVPTIEEIISRSSK